MVNMGYLIIFIAIGILGSVYGDACTTCKTDFEADRTCANFKTYMACLETNLDTCVLSASDAASITSEYSSLTSCTLTGSCMCQKEFFAKDISGATGCSAIKTRIGCLKGKEDLACDDTATAATLASNTDTKMGSLSPSCSIAVGSVCKCEQNYALAAINTPGDLCTETKVYVACLKGKTGTGCDDTSSVVTLATAAGTTLTGIGSTDCPMTDACPCEVEYASSDISTTSSKCTALKNEISCLVGKTGTGCIGTAVHTLAESASETVAADSTCTVTNNCQCEIDYAKTQITAANECSSIMNLTSCLVLETGNGCGDTRLRNDIGAFIQTKVTELGTTCPISSTCQCQIDFAKASIAGSAACTSAKTFTTCVGNIITTTDLACDGVTTQADINNNSTQIEAVFCSSSPVKVPYILLLMPVLLFFI